MNGKNVTEDVREAFSDFLHGFPLSSSAEIVKGVENAVHAWLDENREEIIAAIADKVAHLL